MRFANGQSLIEVLLAVAIFSIVMGAIVFSFIDIYRGSFYSVNRTDGFRLAQEGIEATRAIRDRSFAELVSGTHGIALSGAQWSFSGTSDTSALFTRTIEIASPDVDTRYVTSTVSWVDGGQPRSIVLATIIKNWEKSIAPPSAGNWTNPSLASTVNLPGNTNALSAAASGTIGFIGRQSSSGNDEFYIIDATSSTSPSVLGSLNISGRVYGVAVTGTYAYLATSGRELQVVDVSNLSSPSLVTRLNLPGGGDGRDVAIQGNRLYLTRRNSGSRPVFHVFDISNPASPVELGSANLGAGEYDVALSEVGTSFAFIASARNAQELQAVNVTNPVSMGVGGSLNLSGNANAYAVGVSGTVAYLGTANRGGAGNEFNVVNVATPTSPTNIASASYQSINVIRVANGLVFAGMDDAANELVVFDMSDPNTINAVATLNLSAPVLGLGMSTERGFAVTADNSNEVQILIPAP